MNNTTFFKNRWVKVSFYLTQILLLSWFIYSVITRRPPHFADEGYYFYNAWVYYRAPQSIPLSSSLLLNFGYILGWPYLFMKEPGILFFRVYSMFLWFGGWAIFFYGYLRHWGQKWLLILLLGLTPFGLLFMTMSYNTMPVLFTAAAGGLFLLAIFKKSPLLLFLQGFGIALCMGLSVLSYTPAMGIALIVGLSSLFCIKNRYYSWGILAGFLFSAIGISLITPISPLSLYHFMASNYNHGKHFYIQYYGTPNDLFFRALFNFIAFLLWVLRALVAGCLMLACSLLFFKKEDYEVKYTPKKRYTLLSFYLALAMMLLVTTDRFTLQSIETLRMFYYHMTTVALSWVSIFLTPFIIYWFVKFPKENRWALAFPFIWMFLVFFTENTCGHSTPLYYFGFIEPAFLGIAWILINQQITAKPMALKIGIQCFFGIILFLSLHFFKVTSTETRSPGTLHFRSTTAGNPIPDPKFSGLLASSSYVNYLEATVHAYQQAHCEKRFFASIHSIVLPYYLFHRVSPFGLSWVEAPDFEQLELLRQQKNICLIYRAAKPQEGLIYVNLEANTTPVHYYLLTKNTSPSVYMLAR